MEIVWRVIILYRCYGKISLEIYGESMINVKSVSKVLSPRL